jgi:hypothetical protein
MPTEQPPDLATAESAAGNGASIVHTTLPPDGQEQQLSKSLMQLRAEIAKAEGALTKISRSRTLALSLGIPLLVSALALLAAYEDRIFRYAPNLGEVVGFAGRITILWLLAVLTVGPFYYFLLHKSFVQARDALARLEGAETARVLSSVEASKQYYREEIFRLSSKAASVFFDDERRFEAASGWIGKARGLLDASGSLSEVENCINSLNELVTREEREQKDERYWQYAAVITMLVYVALLVVAALSTVKNQEMLGTSILGVPLSVILWGATGSLAAILHRFYTEQGRIRFAAEFRWLIARPVIGIIMGAVVYLAFFSGLILLGAEGSSTPAAPGERKVFWIIAFLAGFSDKVYLGVIDLLVARTVRMEEVDSNKVITEKERIPEPLASQEEFREPGKVAKS